MTEKIFELLDQQYESLLQQLNDDSVEVDGVSGSSSKLTITERLKILGSVKEYLLFRQKLKPEKAASGISQLREQLSDGAAGRARRGS